MSLIPGNYTIRSGYAFGFFVGRDPRIDDPEQRIETLHFSELPAIWQVQKAEGDRYYLKTDGFATTTVDKFVSTTLLPPGQAWKVQRVPQNGPDAYIILAENESGWFLPEDKELEPVAVQPLIPIPVDPPIYHPGATWIFRSLGELD